MATRSCIIVKVRNSDIGTTQKYSDEKSKAPANDWGGNGVDKCEDVKIEKPYMGVYCHWDGYISNNGDILFHHYKSKNKVMKLINLGDISSLANEVDIPKDKIHNFDNPCDGVTVAYGRDRGEKDIEPIISTEKEFWDDYIEEYGYLYDNGKWFVKTSHKKCDMVELSEDVIKMENEHYDSCFKRYKRH